MFQSTLKILSKYISSQPDSPSLDHFVICFIHYSRTTEPDINFINELAIHSYSHTILHDRKIGVKKCKKSI